MHKTGNSCTLNPNWYKSLTLDDISWVHKPRRHEALLSIGPQHPVPVRVLPVEHRYELPPLHTHIVLIPSNEGVENNVMARWVLQKETEGHFHNTTKDQENQWNYWSVMVFLVNKFHKHFQLNKLHKHFQLNKFHKPFKLNKLHKHFQLNKLHKHFQLNKLHKHFQLNKLHKHFKLNKLHKHFQLHKLHKHFQLILYILIGDRLQKIIENSYNKIFWRIIMKTI